MEAYSHDLRERIVRAVEIGTPKTDVARRFSVSYAAVTSYVRRWRTTGTLDPLPMHLGRKAHIRRDQERALIAQLEAAPDATLAEHVTQWTTDRGITVHLATMARAIHRVGWTFKKKRWQPLSETNRLGPPSASRSPRSIHAGLSRWMRPAPASP